MVINRCHILVPFKDSIWTTSDQNGCVKPYVHNDSHLSILEDGRVIEWEDDYDCNCGCWEGEYDCNVCKVYSFKTKEQTIEILEKYWKNSIPEDILKIFFLV